jgi:hypothetical protein
MALADQSDRAHDLTGRAEAALESVVGNKSGLDRMQRLALRDALDCHDVGPVQADHEGEAGVDPPTIYKDGAGAALAAIAALLGAGEIKAFAQVVEQSHARIVQIDL